jgi:hypothetical protein
MKLRSGSIIDGRSAKTQKLRHDLSTNDLSTTDFVPEQATLLGLSVEIRTQILRYLLVSDRAIEDRPVAFDENKPLDPESSEDGDSDNDDMESASTYERYTRLVEHECESDDDDCELSDDESESDDEDCESDDDVPQLTKSHVRSGLQPQILQVCRQLHHEGIDLLYTNTILVHYVIADSEFTKTRAFMPGNRSIKSSLDQYPSLGGIKKWHVYIHIWDPDRGTEFDEHYVRAWQHAICDDMKALSVLRNVQLIKLDVNNTAGEFNVYLILALTAIRTLRSDCFSICSNAHLSEDQRIAVADDIQSARLPHRPEDIRLAMRRFVDLVCRQILARYCSYKCNAVLRSANHERRKKLCLTYAGRSMNDELIFLFMGLDSASLRCDIDEVCEAAVSVLDTFDQILLQASDEIITRQQQLAVKIDSILSAIGAVCDIRAFKMAAKMQGRPLVEQRRMLSEKGIWEKARELIILWCDRKWVLEKQESTSIFKAYSVQLTKILTNVNEAVMLPMISDEDLYQYDYEDIELSEEFVEEKIDEIERWGFAEHRIRI